VLIGDNLNLNVSGQNLTGGTFVWTGPNGFSSTLQNLVITATTTAAGQYRMIYTSACRLDTQTVNVTVNAGISGRIVSPLNQPVQGVNLLRNNVPTLVNGSYSIAVNPSTPLVLKAAKNNDVNKLNGVSVIDVILVGKHILQLRLLNSPYKLIAADVNRSGTITSHDLILMKRLILGLDNSFPGNTLWAFADSSQPFPNPANPFFRLLRRRVSFFL
jgi:signal transduction protein with GAF and PtsI domain